MRPHLPVNLLFALLACCAALSSSVLAEPLTITANQTFDTDVTWNETTTIGANDLTLTIEAGKTLTQAEGAFNIGNNSLTITGGGVFKIETAATEKVGNGTNPPNRTLTIDNATLDLSSPGASLSLNGDKYTRCKVTVTNGGVLRVGEYMYDGAGLGSMAVNTDYWTLNNGCLEITKETNGSFGTGLTVAAGGGSVEVVNAASTMSITANDTKYIQLNGALTITGAGNMTTVNDNVFRGTGRLIKDGSGTLTLANSSSFTGGVELKGGTLIVSHASGMGADKDLSVTGSAAIGGLSSGFGGLSLSAGAGLDVSAVDGGAGLSMTSGILSLGGQNTMTGNLNLGAEVRIDSTHMTVNGNAMLSLNGALTVNGSLILEHGDGISWSEGTYHLINATGGITGELTNTILLGTDYIGNWSVTDNVLKFVVEQVSSLTWTGDGDNTWTVGGTGNNSPWNAGGLFANGNGVVFGDVAGNAPQTVNIAGQVEPGLIVVDAESTDYTWTGTGSLAGSSRLQKTGSGSLAIATDNAGFSGQILLGGGTVELRHAGALGTGDITFNGGALKYGTGIAADISGQIKTDVLASNAILVDTNGNTVTWASLAGWAGTITRTGNGSLLLAAGAYEGKLTNGSSGSLVIGPGNSSLNGGISGTVIKTGDGTLSLSRDAFNASGDATLVIESGTLDLPADGSQSNNVLSSNLNITLGENAVMKVTHPFISITGTGTLTMGNGSRLRLWNGNSWDDRSINMQIRLDAGEDGYAIIDGSSNGNNSTLTSAITGTGGLKIISDVGGNGWSFKTGWVNNSYNGDTEIAGTGNLVKLTYNIGTAAIASGQTLTPWGQGSVTLGGSEKDVTVTFSGLDSNTVTGGVSLDGNITLRGTNAATALSLFSGATVNVNLNGKVSVETSGAGTAAISSGDSLRMLGGLGGSGTLAVNTRNNAGALTLGGDVSGFSGTLNFSGANLYLDADTALTGVLNASTSKVTALRKQNVTGTLNAASLAVDGNALSPDGAALTVATLALGADAGVSLDINGNIAAGTYTLVSWNNLTAGNFADEGTMTLTGALASLYQGTFNVNAGEKTVTVSVSMADDVVVWDGNPIGAVNNSTTYLFDGSHTGNAVLTGNMNAKGIYFNNGAGEDLSLSNRGGTMTGTGSIVKKGEGKVTFSSMNALYQGTVCIQEGTLAVMANQALGTAAITVEKAGTLEIGLPGNLSGILGDQTPTINGGTLAFTSGGENTLDKELAGSAVNLNVLGDGTVLTVSTAQTKTGMTTVGEGAVLNLGKNGNGAETILYGSLMVNGGTLNTTAGDPFGYNNNGSFGTLTLNSGTWNVGGNNTTMANARMVFNNSRVILNTPGNDNGFDLFSGTNTIVTPQSATGMSVFSVAEGATSSGRNNALTLRGGTAIFDIARGNFTLDATNTADLKLDVSMAQEDRGTNFVKQGNGVLQLTRASSYTNETLIREGTVLLTGAGSLGSGAVTLGGNGDAFLTYAVDADQTVANVISGTGTVTQKGPGKVTLSGANTYAGTTNAEAGTLAAGSATAFGSSTVFISSGATLDIGNYAVNNAISVKSGTADALSTGTITSNGGAIGSLTLGSCSRLNVNGSMAMAAGASFIFDMTGLAAGENALVTLTGGLSLTGTHDVTLNNYDTLTDTGDYSLLTAGSGTLTLGSFNIGELTNDAHPELTYTLGLSADGKTLQLKIESSANLFTWNGTADDGTWSAGKVNNWIYGGGSAPATTDGQPLLFDNTAANKTVTIEGDVAPSSIVVNNSGNNTYTFQGDGSITGASTILTKRGDGILQIRNTNTYGGATSLEGGIVDINGDGALGTGSIIFGGGVLQASGNVTLTQTMVQKNAGDAVKLAASGTGTTLTVDTAGQDSFLSLNWNVSGDGAVALGNIAHTRILSGTVTVANGSVLNLSGGNEIALSGVLKNIGGTLAKTDGGSLLVKVVNGNDALNGMLSDAGGSIVFSGYGAAKADRTITVNGALNADLIDVTYGVTLDLKKDLDVATLQIGGGTVGGNSQASAVNVGAGVTLTSAAGVSLGGANGQGALAGNLNINGGTAVLAGASFLDGSSSGITLNGGMLTMGGDIIGTSGTLTLGEGTLNSSAAWTASAGVMLNAASGRTATVDTTGGDISLNGSLTGSGNLLKTGTGILSIGAASEEYAGTVTLASGTLAFQDSSDGYRAGLNITGGSVTGGQNYKGVKNVSVNADSGVSSISLGGLSGSALKTVTMTEAGTVISGINGTANLDSASLVAGTENVSKTQDLAGSTSMIQFDAAGTQLEIETLTLTLSADVVHAMQGWDEGTRTAWINLTNGALSYGKATFNPVLESLGFAVTGINGGAIGITGDATQIYAVGSQDRTVTDNAELDPYRAAIVDGNLALNLPGVDDTADGLTVNNLSGAASGVITVTGTNDKTASVILNNELLGTAPNTSGPDTKYAGTFNGGTANITKTGEGSLELAGALNTSGTLDMQEGGLILSGTTNLGSLNLNSTNSGALSSLSITGKTAAGTLADEGNGGNLFIGENGTLTLAGADSELSNSAISGSGVLQTADNASLALSGASRLDGVQVNLDGSGTLELGNAANSISGLTGSGALNNGSALEITAAGNALYEGALSGDGSITMNGTGTQILKGNGASGQALNVTKGTLELIGAEDGNGSASYGSLTAENGAHVRLNPAGEGTGAVNTTLTLTNGLNLQNSCLDLLINTNRDDLFSSPVITVQAGDVNLDGTTISLGSLGDYDDPADPTANLNFTLVDAAGAGTVSANGATVDASGYFDFYYQELGIRTEGGRIVVTGVAKTDNVFLGAAGTANSEAGANLLWNNRGNAPKGTQLGDLREAVRNDIQSGNTSRAAHSMAAAAGSTVNALGTAQRDALRDQMGWIRNRTTQMGVNPAYVNEDLPYFHMWMEGTGSYAELDTRGDESGYKLTTWGGTVGMDVDVSDHLTLGAAFTVNYGDLTASAADNADGHLDSYYANLFGRCQSGRWAHTLILTGGWNDAKLNRTVNYGEGSYGTQGNTNGWGFGAMYELTYDVYLNEDRSSVLQPLVNASVVTTRMDGYTETGAGNAGLSVGEQEWTTGTVALGGRWMGLVGSNLFGREALAEVRVNVAQDMGDRRGETNVALLGNPGYTQSVRGAKVGTTALQIGAGLSVPVGTKGTIFVNGNADIRDGAGAVSGSVGYRYDF